MRSRKLSDRAFVLLGVTFTLAVISAAAWLDRDMLDPAYEERASQQIAIETADFERGFAQGSFVSGARVKTAYEQGLQEGAKGMLEAVTGVNSLAATQACLALGAGRVTPVEGRQ